MRFKGFDSSWNISAFIDHFINFSTNSLSWDFLNFNSGEIKNLHYGLIHSSKYSVFNSCNAPFINKDSIPKKYTIYKSGDLILADTSEDKKDVGKALELVLDNYPIICGLHTMHFRERKPSTIPFYKSYYFSSMLYQHFTHKYSEGVKVFSLKPSLYKYFTFSYPCKDEQQKIVSFLRLIDNKIEIIENKIDILKKYKEGIMFRAFIEAQCRTFKLEELTSNNTITLGRGNIIPKQKGIYPVYSSSAQNNGLFCYKNDYMFDEELVTWSVDGGGRPFIRKKHKFSITNVCGFAKINNNNIVNYWWLYICFWNNWKSINFDYTTKAHPSVIDQLYKIKLPTIDYQIKYSTILDKIESILKINNECLFALNKLKKQLMKDLFL